MDLNIETPFGICDKTGWVHGYFCNGIDDIINDYGDITDKIDYDIDMSGVGKFRPKSLNGIENNNGWIKIESEKDLPKEECEVFFIKNDLIFTGYFYYNQFNIGIFSNNSDCYFFEEVTQYQVFKKPSLPIY